MVHENERESLTFDLVAVHPESSGDPSGKAWEASSGTTLPVM
ncbi:hypothetical protein SBADM41S_04512 [Streptomyces badius]